MNVLNMVVEDFWAVQRFRVCVHVHKKEQSKRNDAGQLMQLSEQKCIAKFNSHRNFRQF